VASEQAMKSWGGLSEEWSRCQELSWVQRSHPIVPHLLPLHAVVSVMGDAAFPHPTSLCLGTQRERTQRFTRLLSATVSLLLPPNFRATNYQKIKNPCILLWDMALK